MSPITNSQWKSIFKAITYAFGSAFFGSLALQSQAFLTAVENGQGGLQQLAISIIVAAIIAGINGVAFAIEKLNTTSK
jgi:hypothetical protein